MRASEIFLRIVAGLILAIPVQVSAQTYPTGPFADEAAYQSYAQSKTTTISVADVVGVIRSVELVLDDQIDGKCWTNGTAVAARVRAELEKFGIAVYQERLAFRTNFAPLLKISALGGRAGNVGCVGSASFSVSYWGITDLGSLAYNDGIFQFESLAVAWQKDSIFTNSRNLDEQLLNQAQEWVDTFIADISKARRSSGVEAVLRTWPNPTPMTQSRYEEILKSVGNSAE